MESAFKWEWFPLETVAPVRTTPVCTPVFQVPSIGSNAKCAKCPRIRHLNALQDNLLFHHRRQRLDQQDRHLLHRHRQGPRQLHRHRQEVTTGSMMIGRSMIGGTMMTTMTGFGDAAAKNMDTTAANTENMAANTANMETKETGGASKKW